MKSKIAHIISTFRALRDGWLYVVPIVLAAFFEHQRTETSDWLVFINFLLTGGISFVPVFLFTYYKSDLKKKWSKLRYRATYGFLFLIYPLLLLWIVVSLLDEPGISPGYFAIAGAGMLTVEGLLQLRHFFQSGLQKKSFGFSPKIGFETSILSVLAILSCIIAFMAVSSLPTVPAGGELVIELRFSPAIVFDHFLLFLGYTLQFFIYFLCWYLFYYLNHYWLYRNLLLTKGILFYLISLSAAIVLIYPMVSQIIIWLPLTERIPDLLPSGNNNPFDLLNGVIGSLVIAATFPLILIRQWYQKNQRITDLERQKAETELAMLKQQINPHFFLNTLNNLYALSLKKSDRTPEMILKLSELMRYVLYRGNNKRVKLEDEIAYIEGYLELQQVRLHQQLDLTFEKNISDADLTIPPLLLIVLVENAFKHGIEPDDRSGYLCIKLDAGVDHLRFVCENSVPGTEEEQAPGIGLDNLRRRLELQFPARHDLQVTKNTDSFKAKLVIQLKNDES